MEPDSLDPFGQTDVLVTERGTVRAYGRLVALAAVFSATTVFAWWSGVALPLIAYFVAAVAAYSVTILIRQSRTSSRFIEAAAETWVASAFIVLLIVAFGGREVAQMDGTAGDGSPTVDFVAFYSAGRLASTDPAELYRADLQAEFESEIIGRPITSEDPEYLPFAYPAVSALLFVPFSKLPYAVAFYASVFANLTILGLAVGGLAASLPLPQRASTMLAISTAGLVAVPVTLLEGQVSFIVLALVALTLIDLRKGNPVRAGVWTGLLAFKPTVVPVLIIWLVLRRHYRTVACALGVALALAIASVAWTGLEGTVDFINLTRTMASGGFASINTDAMPNLRSLAASLEADRIGWLGSTALVVTGFLMVGRRTAIDAAGTGLVIATAILTAPHVHVQELSLLIIPAAMLLAGDPELSFNTRWTVLGLMLAPGFLLAFTARFGLQEWPLLAGFLLLVWMVSLWGVRSAAPPTRLETLL